MSTRNIVYGALEPTEGLEHFWGQVAGQHRYRNHLVELELRRRQEGHDILRRHYPRIVELEALEVSLEESHEAAQTVVRCANAQARRRVATSEQKQAVTDARNALRACRTELKDLRRTAWADTRLQDELEQASQAHHARVRHARAHSSLYWGNYLQVEEAAASFSKGPPPRFHRRAPGGKVAVQIQGGMTWEEAVQGADTRFRVEEAPPAPGASPTSRRSQIRKRVKFWIRVGSTGEPGRRPQPLWLVIPGTVHRPLPEGARIKWVFAHAVRVGSQTRWTVRLVVDWPEEARPGAGQGLVGIDLGWRLLPDGLRVAFWQGDDGQTGQLLLPLRDVTRWEHADAIRSARDRAFDEVRTQLQEWLEGAVHSGIVPEWLTQRLATLHAWKSQARLALTLTGWVEGGQTLPGWNERRFPGDEEIHARLTAWLEQDRHLWDWEGFERRKATNWRSDTYRVFVARLRQHYRTAVIEDTDWATLSRRPQADSDDPLVRKARYLQRVASPGNLVRFIREGMPACLRVEASGTTTSCGHCGRTEDINRFRLEHQCTCGVTWDQDQNAARNILARGQAATEPATEPATEEPAPGQPAT